MQMTAGLDCGPVYVAKEIDIAASETAGDLHDRLATLGGELLCRHLTQVLAGDMETHEQNEAAATYAAKINKSDAQLDWTRPADELQRRVRAYNPVPGAYFFADRLRVKCWVAQAISSVNGHPGTTAEFSADGIVIACGEGGLRLDSLQLPGKRRVAAKEFVAQIDLRQKNLLV